MQVRVLITALMLALAACSAEPPPPPAPTAAKDAQANPLAGTVLEGQGEAMQKARAVEDTLQKAAQARERQLDEAAK